MQPLASAPERSLTIAYRASLSLEMNSSGSEIAVISGGAEYVCVSLRKKYGLRNSAVADIVRATPSFPLAAQALELSKTMRVPESSFNSFFDDECEIRSGAVPKLRSLHFFRSFAWQLLTHCDNAGLLPGGITLPALLEIAEAAHSGSAMHYSGNGVAPSICAVPDMYVTYAPECMLQLAQEVFGASEETLRYQSHMRSKYPNWEEAVPEVASLDCLRKDLTVLWPAVEKLSASQAQVAKSIVKVWCTLALAANEPFFTESNPASGEYIRFSD